MFFALSLQKLIKERPLIAVFFPLIHAKVNFFFFFIQKNDIQISSQNPE